MAFIPLSAEGFLLVVSCLADPRARGRCNFSERGKTEANGRKEERIRENQEKDEVFCEEDV